MGATCLLMPLPRLSLVVLFKLYILNRPIPDYVKLSGPLLAVMTHIVQILCLNILEKSFFGLSIWTTAAPSRSLTSTMGVLDDWFSSSGRQ